MQAALSSESARSGHQFNSYGFLRLLFASLVIISHSPELVDGSRNRELLTRAFGSMSFGELAVEAFFLISGFLITSSFQTSISPWSYLKKRTARIYPAFLVAYLFCLFVVCPLGGGNTSNYFSRENLIWVFASGLCLQPPFSYGSFHGTPYAVPDGAMWTISYEFRCYILVMLLGMSGILKARFIVIVLATVLLVCTSAFPIIYQPYIAGGGVEPSLPSMGSAIVWKQMLIGYKWDTVRLFGVFLTGSCFYLYRDKILFSGSACIISTVALLICLKAGEHTATAGMAMFGGYLIFAAAELNRINWLAKVNNENDVSYGTYLYAWPASKLILWYFPQVPVLVLGVATLIVSYGFGWASWLAVEKPVMALVRRPAVLGAADSKK